MKRSLSRCVGKPLLNDVKSSKPLFLDEGYEESDELLEDIRQFVKTGLSAHAAPREVEISNKIPKTRSGKIMRRLLKARELGLPEGDTSTLEY